MKRKFQWHGIAGNGTCRICQLRTTYLARGPKGGMVRAFLVKSEWGLTDWVLNAPECRPTSAKDKQHKFQWIIDLVARGTCELCDLKTTMRPFGPRGGMKQVYWLGDQWVTTMPECGAYRPPEGVIRTVRKNKRAP